MRSFALYLYHDNSDGMATLDVIASIEENTQAHFRLAQHTLPDESCHGDHESI